MVLKSHKLKWFVAVLAIILAAMVAGGVVLKRYSDAKFKILVESKAAARSYGDRDAQGASAVR